MDDAQRRFRFLSREAILGAAATITLTLLAALPLMLPLATNLRVLQYIIVPGRLIAWWVGGDNYSSEGELHASILYALPLNGLFGAVVGGLIGFARRRPRLQFRLVSLFGLMTACAAAMATIGLWWGRVRSLVRLSFWPWLGLALLVAVVAAPCKSLLSPSASSNVQSGANRRWDYFRVALCVMFGLCLLGCLAFWAAYRSVYHVTTESGLVDEAIGRMGQIELPPGFSADMRMDLEVPWRGGHVATVAVYSDRRGGFIYLSEARSDVIRGSLDPVGAVVQQKIIEHHLRKCGHNAHDIRAGSLSLPSYANRNREVIVNDAPYTFLVKQDADQVVQRDGRLVYGSKFTVVFGSFVRNPGNRVAVVAYLPQKFYGPASAKKLIESIR